MTKLLVYPALLLPALHAATHWTVRIEEPTGIYRRHAEIVSVPLEKLGRHTSGFRVTAPDGRAAPWQISGNALLFPASVIPGQIAEYSVVCCDAAAGPQPSSLVARKAGMSRVELANDRMRVVLDASVPAIVEAYNLSAASQRAVNLVETTPETSDPNDIHAAAAAEARQTSTIPGENIGWTTLGGRGPMTAVDILESGPLQARVQLRRNGESWLLTLRAGDAALRWQAIRGFRFFSLSAAPYLPFDRCVDGDEYRWPSGPDPSEPPNHDIAPRSWRKPPGGHFAYYQRQANYGAIGFVLLDSALETRAACSAKFEIAKPAGATELAITFPRWNGDDTLLEARREARVLLQPLLVAVETPREAPAAPPAAAFPVPPQTRAVSSFPPEFQLPALSLDGNWQLAWGEKGAGPGSPWRTVKVPGSAHVQWLPESELYTRAAEWVSGKEWWYRRTLTVPPAFAGRTLRLQFDATDYYAEAFIDGVRIGRHEGYIDPYEYDVTAYLIPGREHELKVRVWTPVSYYWKHRPYTIKGAYGAVDQKPDDITALGITRSVRLVASSPAYIRDVAVNPRLTDGGAELDVELDASSPGEWQLTLGPRTFQDAAHYQLRTSASRATIAIPKARLWWTWDHGRPDLYTLEARLLSPDGATLDARRIPVGLREVEKRGWDFYLNRKKIFIRGTNSYFHLFLSEMDRAKYTRDIDLILKMNVNMVRLHCHFQNPEFYQLADERGLLIWQDFLEAWYPHDTDFSLHAARLYDNHLRYVRNHPSIALWAVSDEESLENYRDLTKHLAARASFLDPQLRPVVRSTGRYGDAHLYHGWYGGTLWNYAKMIEPFVSELGATAIPNQESLDKYLAGKWPIRDFEEEWRFRRLQIGEAFEHWGDPGGQSLAEYIPRTQAYVSRLFQVSIERMRRRKADGAGGILHFFAIDIWPSVTMAAIDFYRVPTRVFDTVRRSFQPVVASVEYSQDQWTSGEQLALPVWAINDGLQPVPAAKVVWRIEDAAGRTMQRGEQPVALPENSAVKATPALWTAGTPGPHRLIAEVHSNNQRISENIFDFTVAPRPR